MSFVLINQVQDDEQLVTGVAHAAVLPVRCSATEAVNAPDPVIVMEQKEKSNAAVRTFLADDSALFSDPEALTEPISGSCITIAPGTQSLNGRAAVASLGTIFHEYGHIADRRIRNGYNRSDYGCEQQSLEEQIAGMFGMTVFMHTWGINSQFTDADGHSEHAWWDYPWHQGSVNGLGPVGMRHGDFDSDLTCYNDPATTCSEDTIYSWGQSIVQAYWEAAHGVNCGGGGNCVEESPDGVSVTGNAVVAIVATQLLPQRAALVGYGVMSVFPALLSYPCQCSLKVEACQLAI